MAHMLVTEVDIGVLLGRRHGEQSFHVDHGLGVGSFKAIPEVPKSRAFNLLSARHGPAYSNLRQSTCKGSTGGFVA